MAWPLSSKVSSEMLTNSTRPSQVWSAEVKRYPENLETRLMHNCGTILTFGDRILVAGYFYNPNGRSP